MWQQFYEANDGNKTFELLTVAMDAQGAAAARPYLEKAGATYQAVVDHENRLGTLFGFKAIPNAWLIDEAGVLRHQKLGFHIERTEHAQALLDLLAAPAATKAEASPTDITPPQAGSLAESAALLAGGDKRAAIEELIAAFEADPENFVIRKQVWYLLHPERFSPEIDTAWQRDQQRREREVGFRVANLIPTD